MIKKIFIFGLFALFILIPVIPLYFYGVHSFDALADVYYSSIILGVLGYYFFSIVLIISARIRLLDILFGHDKVMMFHGIVASVAFLCSFLHVILKNIIFFEISVQTIAGGFALFIFAVVIIVTLLFMANPFIRIHWKKKKIDYSKVKFFHNFSVIASITMIIHVNIALSTTESFAKQSSMLIIGCIAVLFFIYHKFIRVIILKNNNYTVVSVKRLTDFITEISFKKNNAAMLKRKPGQFAFFRFKSKAVSFEEHPFTISSDSQSIEMSITIKKSGDYTAQLSDIIPGDIVYCDGPYGVFSPKDNGGNYVFIAGGIGITPFISILKSFSKSAINSKITLIWSVRNVTDLFENELFEKIEKDNTNFTYIPLVDTDITETFISTVKALDKPSVYFCGPPPMTDFVKKCIKTQKLRIRDFHYERFSL